MRMKAQYGGVGFIEVAALESEFGTDHGQPQPGNLTPAWIDLAQAPAPPVLLYLTADPGTQRFARGRVITKFLPPLS
jgi:hypothetical protein